MKNEEFSATTWVQPREVSLKELKKEMPFIERLMSIFLGKGDQGWDVRKSHVKAELAKLPCGEEVINALY